jgi:hypothetical protein
VLQHQCRIRLPRENGVNNVGCQQREAQDPAYLTLRDVLGVADLAHGRVGALIKHALPPPSARECLRSVPSGCGFEVGASSLPSGATIRLRPPRRWKRIGIRTTSVVPSSLVSAL